MLTPLVLITPLRHGQVEVERGFNNGNLVLKDYFKIDFIVPRRFTLMKSVSATHERYCLHLEEQKKDKVQNEIDSKK